MNEILLGVAIGSVLANFILLRMLWLALNVWNKEKQKWERKLNDMEIHLW